MSQATFAFTEKQERMARYAKALSHPARLFILEFLNRQACCFAGNLVDVLPMAQSTVSQHLKELKDAGLIQGSVDPPRVRYCINRENWAAAQSLFETYFDKAP